MSSIRPARAAVVACAALVSACIPVVVNRYPAISGTVVAGPAPVDDAQLLRVPTPSTDCSQFPNVVTADKQGRFLLPRSRMLVMGYFGGEMQSDWTLCVRSGDRTWFGYWFYAHSSPDTMTIHCDLTRAVKPPEHGVCEVER